MFEFLSLFDQLLLISTLLSIYLFIFHIPAITHHLKQYALRTDKDTYVHNFSCQLILKISSLIYREPLERFVFQKMKIKYTSNNDLEDCCPLL
jgi:hypothetical protein